MNEQRADSDMARMRLVMMARHPRPGYVKTRLIGDRFDAQQAADIARACLACSTNRLAAFDALTIAVTPDDAISDVRSQLRSSGVEWTKQGSGDLGDRLCNVWRAIDPDVAVAFFGMDSPDMPAHAIAGIPALLMDHDVVIGPTDDGGYWTIAANRLHQTLFEDIEWGGTSVYEQTRYKAEKSGLAVAAVPMWYDVDTPQDVDRLLQRLQQPPTMLDPHLCRLERSLQELTTRA